MHNDSELLQKVVSLCKRRGFVFQSSEIYGGLKSAYDFGPLGTELKRNLMNLWWRTMVQQRQDVVGLDASIMMHPKVWQASGHVAGFCDPLVDCRNCKERFRADKAPKAPVGQKISYLEGGKKGGRQKEGHVGPRGYICPVCQGPDLSDERQFNLMFRTSLGPVDPIGQLTRLVDERPELKGAALKEALEAALAQSAVYLRPETAQAMFVQFLNVQQSMGMKVPFGIAQMGKSFRNEITTEHFIFRCCEFEQMELEFFVPPGEQRQWLEYWRVARMQWWQRLSNQPERFRCRPHDRDELAHYADACYDIEYQYPWGWGELEGVASRTDYDLNKHQEHAGVKLSYFDVARLDPKTQKPGWRYVPYVIEPAAGATRGVLVYLMDAYHEEKVQDAKGNDDTRTVLRLHPQLAPIKAAILPLVKKDGMPEIANKLYDACVQRGLQVRLDEQHAIGKRYRRHDEIGTPFCLTVDGDSVKDNTVTIRHRDSMQQERLGVEPALDLIVKAIL